MDFSFLEPYCDAETDQAIEQILTNPLFPTVVKALPFPADEQKLIETLKGIHTIDQFQERIMLYTMQQLMGTTTQGVEVEGLEKLDSTKQYLYISNHRDIFLDAAMLDALLKANGLPTCYISFGDNLLANDFVRQFCKLNKMFPIQRSGSRREQYMALQLTSNYIRMLQQERKESVWISQRNGRTKDGDDATEQGLIKMFAMAGKGSFVEQLEELNIVPIAISYELEPCLERKAKELYIRQQEGHYEKQPMEDMQSTVEGILQPKGHVHYTICQPIDHNDLVACEQSGEETNSGFLALTRLIDQRIHQGYHLYENNWEGYRWYESQIKGKKTSADQYTLEDFKQMIYANPIINKQRYENQ